ncbi:MAG TPA: SpoIID/LytB domain-containing protein [Patescibacteria group bacterium]|nr:SpoIID/LytB domain-containing protein [Patescibacteria group bacterium]
MPASLSRTVHGRKPAVPLAIALAALLLAGLVAVPPRVDAASQTMVPVCAGVNLRTGASTGRAVRVRLAANARVTVVATVPGSSWRTDCAGLRAGSTWHRITHVNGVSVQSRFGVAHLFAASGLLRRAPAASPTPAPPAAVAPVPADLASTGDALGAELMRLVNLDRAALGRPAFQIDPGLAAIARDAPFTCPTDPSLTLRGRAADMAARDYFGHIVAGCFLPGTTTPYPALGIVRSIFGYTLARSEILHWNTLGAAATTYRVGCDIAGGNCVGGTTTTPTTVATAQRSFMGSGPHRASQLAGFQRFGCGVASTPGATRTYFACLFADGGPALAPIATPVPSPAPVVDPAPVPAPVDPAPAPSPAASTTMVPACADVNLRTAASTGASVATRIGLGTTLTVDAVLDGSAWGTDCAGWRSGSTWFRITHVNGTAVAALHGVAALFAATGVLSATGAPAPVPVAATQPSSTTGPTALGPSVTFFGRGWGHGVGLSQFGARGRALAGQSAAEILAHYYAGTTIGLMPEGATIRVLLLDNHAPTAANPLTVHGRGDQWTISGVAALFPADARLRLIPTTSGTTTSWRAIVDAAGVVLHDAPAPPDLRVQGVSPAATLQLPARSSTFGTFRGAFRIILSGARADVVNELPLESYLRGVVPAEMPTSWPVAARTAQTIAARSYAAARLRPGVSTFDVFDDTRSQVYRGVRAEAAAADAVITETASQVLYNGAEIASALYHSTAGGATEHNENVYVLPTGARFVMPVSYLRGSPDRDANGVSFDATSPHATWQTNTYSLAQLSAIFAADSRTNVGTLEALDLRDRGVSGRLVSVTLVGSTGARTVSGNVFVAVFNARRPAGDPLLRSSLLDLAPIP